MGKKTTDLDAILILRAKKEMEKMESETERNKKECERLDYERKRRWIPSPHWTAMFVAFVSIYITIKNSTSQQERVHSNWEIRYITFQRDSISGLRDKDVAVLSDSLETYKSLLLSVREERILLRKSDDAPQDYRISCDQFCGRGHFGMKGRIDAPSQEDYDRWLVSKQLVDVIYTTISDSTIKVTDKEIEDFISKYKDA